MVAGGLDLNQQPQDYEPFCLQDAINKYLSLFQATFDLMHKVSVYFSKKENA